MSSHQTHKYHQNQKNKMLEADADEQYFNQESDESPHQPQPQQNNDEDEIDPLDAFMEDIDQKIKIQTPNHNKNNKLNKQQIILPSHNKNKNDEGDDCQNYEFDYVELNPLEQNFMQDAMSDEQQIQKQKHKIIQPLKPFNFEGVILEDFDKNFYEQHEEITGMAPEVHKKLLKDMEIKISGAQPLPKPIVSFGYLPITDRIIKVIQSEGFQRPTPIQAQALPCAFSGRDIVGIAKTGSGKTIAFVWPMIIHVINQRRSQKNQGPIALILAPTRELCQQIYLQTKKYSKKEGLKIDCLLGGQNKHQQWKSLKAGTDILIASPGRLIQLLRKKATNLLRTTYLVLDQADRMLSMGFQQQIRSIISQTREDRQTLLFTATMKKSMQLLVGDIVTTPIRIIVGDQGSANEDVKQEVIIIEQMDQKMQWLRDKMMRLIIQGKVLIFANQKQQCEQIGKFLEQEMKIPTLIIHGDKNQYERTTIMNSFKSQQSVLVATDIASRGIDVKNIKTVINFQCPKNIQVYIHRIGRAGRAGDIGTAYTFLHKENVRFGIQLIKIFQNTGYPVPDRLEDLAMLDDGFRRKRISSRMGVSFAKGKDATKYLNFALKRQQERRNSRAGLGFDQFKQSNKTTNPQLNLSSEIKNLDSISDISTMIRNKLSQQSSRQKFEGRFVLANKSDTAKQEQEATVTYFKKQSHHPNKDNKDKKEQRNLS